MAEHNSIYRLRGALLCLGACALLLCAPTLRAFAEERGPLACSYAGVAAHVHTADCYNAAGELVCPLPEIPAHVHTEACYTGQRRLACTLEETPGHQHSESCYAAVRGELLCADESEEHEHTDACYAWAQELCCGLGEGEGAHVHDEGCYETDQVLSCGQLGLHTHDAACYDASGALCCGLPQFEEHVHGPACFAAPEEEEPEQAEAPKKGDPTADVESWEDWDEMFRDLDRSGPWNETLLAVAQSQIGYRESSRNFDVDSEYIPGGYTRYGAWYGRPYSPWCAMFLSFCLHYAGIPEEAMPRECGVRRWVEELEARGQYVPAAGYTPRPGDLVFFDDEGDGLADHVGLVESIYEDEADVQRLITIEGNRSPAVERFTYRLSNPCILGFGLVPDRPDDRPPASGQTDSAPAEESAEAAEEQAEPAAESAEAPAEIAEPAPVKLLRKTPLPSAPDRPETIAPAWKHSPKS